MVVILMITLVYSKRVSVRSNLLHSVLLTLNYFPIYIKKIFTDIKTNQGKEGAQPKTNPQKDNAEKDFKTV